MSTVGSTSATSSTAQQDRVASGNSHQARRGSGDSKVFANMLAAAADSATPEALSEARKKPTPQDNDQGGDDASHDLDNLQGASGLVDGPRVKTPDDHGSDDGARASDDTDGRARAPGRGARGGISTLTLAARETTSARAVQAGIADAASTSDTQQANDASGLAPLGAAPGDSSVGTVGNSLATALAAALEDAMDVSDDVTLSATAPVDSQGAAGGGGEGSAAEVGALANEPPTERDAAPQTPPGPAQNRQDAVAKALAKIGQQVSYWLGKGVSQAQLTVHGAQGDAVDVRVLLRDGQAHLEFLTNNEQTRAAIAQNGTDALRAVLGQNGIELASLSVDAQASGGQHPHGQASQDGSQSSGRGLGVQSAANGRGTEAAPPPGRMVHWTSNAVLDAYA